MLKCFLLLCFAALGPMVLSAQQTAKSDSLLNPFGAVVFENRPTDTLTLNASYANDFGPLTEDHLLTLESISKLYGLDIKKFRFSMAFKIDGYPQTFYMPCCDDKLYNLLLAKANTSRFELKCVVYRFYTLDGTTNFFYINKAILTGI